MATLGTKKLKAKLYYDNILQKKGKLILTNSSAIDFSRDDGRYSWIFVKYLQINDKTNTIRKGKWKAVLSDSDIKKLQKLKDPSFVSKRRVSKRRVSKRRVSKRR